jgi:hypothetical protein
MDSSSASSSSASTTPMDFENSVDQELKEGLLMVETLLTYAKEAQALANASISNGTEKADQEVLIEMAIKKWQRHSDLKKSMAGRFPLEPMFMDKNPSSVSKKQDNKVVGPKISELPYLLATREKANHPTDFATNNVKDFVDMMERVMTLHKLHVDTEYPRYLPLIISKSYRQFLDGKRHTLGDSVETWPMVKDWLMEFTNTPKQKVKNIGAWLDLSPVDGESGEDFFFRASQFANDIDLDNISVATLAFYTLVRNVNGGWRSSIAEAIRDGNFSFINKTFKEQCVFVGDLDLDAHRDKVNLGKRKFVGNNGGNNNGNNNFGRNNGNSNGNNNFGRNNNNFGRNNGSSNGNNNFGRNNNNSGSGSKRSKHGGPTGPHPQGGIYCNYGCGEQYLQGHYCGPSNNQQQATTPKVNRMAIRSSQPPATDNDSDSEMDEDMALSKVFKKKAKLLENTKCKQKNNKVDDLSRQYILDNEINVPLFLENHKVLALLDSGANFSSVSHSFCLDHKITILKNKNNISILLADANSSIKSYGYTSPLQIRYNGSTFTCQLEVMDLAFNRTMSIGTDLMNKFGIGYTGLATSWDPPVKNEAENPFKDKPTPNDDPFGTDEQRFDLIQYVQPSIDANQAIPVDSFCTHPDALVYLDTPDDAAYYRPQYPIAHALKSTVQLTVDKWLADGIITPVPSNINNRWNSPLILVPKKDMDGNYTAKRPCLDPRHINKYLKQDRFPLPKIDDIFNRLAGSNLYTTLDLTNAFHRFPIHPPHQHKTAFTSVNGQQYMFKGTPFGLAPISSKFQRVLSSIFCQPPFVHFVASFIDDIVVYSKSIEEHKFHVVQVIDELTKIKLILNPKKCFFAQRTIYLLGFCIGAGGQRSIDPRKLINTIDIPTPQTGKDIMSFMGTVGYLRLFVPMVSSLAAPLDALRSHDGKLGTKWTEKEANAFVKVKKALAHNIILHAPNWDLPFHLATDASDVGIGGVLYQYEEDVTHTTNINSHVNDDEHKKQENKINGDFSADGPPAMHNKQAIRYIAFIARSLSTAEARYSVTRRESLSIVFSLNKLHQYLWGNHFYLYTDHRALLYMHTQKDVNKILASYFEVLMNYNFTVIHLPGVDNKLPDALSRLFPAAKSLEGDSTTDDHNAHSHLYASESANKQCEINTTTESSSKNPDHTKKINRMATISYLKENMTEPPTDEEKNKLLSDTHLLGHFGAEAIIKTIHNEGIHWTNLKDQALKLVQSCAQCQKFNIVKKGYNPHRPVHALYPGDVWHIDLAGQLPLTQRGNTYLLVMIDICSRFVILRPLPNKTAEAVVQAILPIFCTMGIPQVLSSDNGSEFSNQVMKRFKELAGFDHRLITPYHPQANGAAEKAVGTAMTVIKKAVEGVDDEWDLYVYAAQLAINKKPSKRLDTPPFNIMFGRKLNDFKNYNEENNIHTPLSKREIEQRLSDMKNIIFPAIQEKTAITIKKQKEHYDNKNMQKEYSPGTYVMVKIPVNLRSKMDATYEGPYIVIRKTQAGTYVLKDTEGDKLRRNYTVEELKEVSVPGHKVKETFEVESILAHRKQPGTNKYEYKVKWLNYSDAHNTWEPESNFYSKTIISQYWRHLTGHDKVSKRIASKKRKALIENNETVRNVSRKRRNNNL